MTGQSAITDMGHDTDNLWTEEHREDETPQRSLRKSGILGLQRVAGKEIMHGQIRTGEAQSSRSTIDQTEAR